jgi:hypothetical protein
VAHVWPAAVAERLEDRVSERAGAVAILGPVVARVRAELGGVALVQRGQPDQPAGQRQVALARADRGQLGRDVAPVSEVVVDHLDHVAPERRALGDEGRPDVHYTP